MNTPASTVSIYEDWQRRRSSILESADSSAWWVDSQIKVFDYLLRRYCDDEEVYQPSRSPLDAALYSDDRRTTVHQHLGRGQIAGTKDRFEAASRITRVLQRMAAGERSEDAYLNPSPVEDYTQIPIREWKLVAKAIQKKSNVDQAIRNFLKKHPRLPAEAIGHLALRAGDASTVDTVAVELLVQAENKSTLHYCCRAWRERLAQDKGDDEVSEALVARIRQSESREDAAELIRELLADDVLLVRIEAARLIAELGNLDDIGLLSELIELPDPDEEERRVLVGSMEAIARK